MSFLRSSRALLDRFRAGESEALEAVYWAYVGKVERLLKEGFASLERGTRVPGAEQRTGDIADLVQEVFTRAFSEKSRHAYDGLRDFGPYLYTIARNALTDWHRVRGREIVISGPAFEASLENVGVPQDPPPWDDPAVVDLVERYLAELPQELQMLHRLRHAVGVSQEQAARELGVSRQSLRTLEKRLRDGLAAKLDAAGIRVTDRPESSGGRTGVTGKVNHASKA